MVSDSTITRNSAAGGQDGTGKGGGVYSLGTFTSTSTVIKKKHASTSNDDVYP